ncbi:MAG: hypothetical protein ABI411_18355, partial [Tahibacter sp.]
TSTALTYAVKLGFGVWISCNFSTGFLLFNASLIGDTEMGLVFGGEPVAPVVGLNVLAVGILFWLFGAMRRARPGYVEKPKTALSGRAFRFAWKSLLVLLVIVLVPLLGLWIFNRIDESSTRSAERWFAPTPHTLPDAENAWLYMLGFGAAENEDPIAFGRRRLDAYEARITQHGPHPASAEEEALKADPLAFQSKDAKGNTVEFCDPDTTDCLSWAKTEVTALGDLERANALLLARYDTLLGMIRVDDLATPSLDDTFPDTNKEANLYRSLILRDLSNPATRANALQRMARVIAFWRHMEEPAQGLIMKAIADRTQERYLRILDALIHQSGESGLNALHEVIDVALRAPTPAQREWEPVLHREALQFGLTLDRSVFTNPIDAARYCEKDCLKQWLIAQFYTRQATRNLYARLWDAVLVVHNGEPKDMSAANARVSEIVESAMPLTASAKQTLRRMAYNATGEILTVIALPAYAEYINNQHDTEALRRMLLLKIAALKEHVSAQKMPEFLAQRGDTLSNPYTGEPFEWDTAKHEIHFDAKSKKWKVINFGVSYVAESGGAVVRVRGKK